MKNDMTLMGIGPRLGLISLPYVLLALAVMYRFPGFLKLTFAAAPVFRVIAVFWLAVGFIFWTFSAIYFIRNFKPGELLTSGPFAICRNP
ncbi:MAG TPA: hypothetical protein VK172_01420, partial [Lentimicrobium sp.]|nr:hypothetical protein [Lentimicrobium sp.]